jgi:hypothetical protein
MGIDFKVEIQYGRFGYNNISGSTWNPAYPPDYPKCFIYPINTDSINIDETNFRANSLTTKIIGLENRIRNIEKRMIRKYNRKLAKKELNDKIYKKIIKG